MELSLQDKRIIKFAFWMMIGSSLVATFLSAIILSSKKDIAVIGMFFWGILSAFIGAYFGAWLGGKLEEDSMPCMDMGVLSSALSFLISLFASLLYTALAASWFVYHQVHALIWWFVLASPFLIGIFSYLFLKRKYALILLKKGAHDDSVVDIKMKNRISLLLLFSILLIIWITIGMVAIMQAMMDMLIMIAAMIWGMMGGMVGGMIGGWLGGTTDVHQGAPPMENPIMINGMALMGGMMGAMIGGGVGSYMGLLGGVGILGSVITTAVLFLASYYLLIKGRFGIIFIRSS
jgi:MFS family permease